MEITVREAGAGDAAAIALVNVASWEAAYRGIVDDRFLDNADVEGRRVRWSERITAGTDPILVAVAGDVLAGYCSLVLPARDTDLDELTGEIGAIYVLPERFRGGVGSAMLGVALDLMRDRGLRDATLWVLTENARARSFYARHGFSPDGSVQWIEQLSAEEIRVRRAL